MELSQLIYFRTMAHIRHFTKASAALHVSQSALSRSIGKLEAELEAPLFERSDKGLALTGDGQQFLQHVERALQELELARQDIAAKGQPDHGIVNLSFIHSLNGHILPKLLKDFSMEYPDIKFHLNQNNSAFLSKQVERGKTDLCLCSTMLCSEHVAWNYLWSEELFIVVPRNHALASRQSIHLKEVESEPLITLKPAYSLRILADQFFELADSHPNIIFEGDDITAIANLVASDLGVGLIPRLPGTEHLDLAFIPVSFPVCKRAVGIAWNTAHKLSPAAVCFQQFVLNRFSCANPKK